MRDDIEGLLMRLAGERSLTEAEYAALIRARDAELFCALSEEEQAQLRVLLQKIADGHEAWKKRRGIR